MNSGEKIKAPAAATVGTTTEKSEKLTTNILALGLPGDKPLTPGERGWREVVEVKQGPNTCTRCHRVLKDPESRKRGMGPVCWAKGRRTEMQPEIIPPVLEPAFPRADVVLRRDDKGQALTNVPRLITVHSPDGFEWGYGGSGPADLALNILACLVDRETAWTLHQDFKWEYVATIPHQGGVIYKANILAWLRARQEAKSIVNA